MSEQEAKDKASETTQDGSEANTKDQQPAEYGGPRGKEPTRYGDWEKKGRCIDF